MEAYSIIKDVAEESLTLKDCKFLLSKTGDQESTRLFKDYFQKYHPKNSSLTTYFDKLASQNDMSFRELKDKGNGKKEKGGKYFSLPSMKAKEEKDPLKLRLMNIINMTKEDSKNKENCFLPKLSK